MGGGTWNQLTSTTVRMVLWLTSSSISNWTLRLAPLCPIADAKEESQSTGSGSRTHRGMWSLTLCSNLAVKLDLSAVDSSW